ncbi:hypothetical protein ACLKA7_011116 [Drosophila subpalustris]
MLSDQFHTSEFKELLLLTGEVEGGGGGGGVGGGGGGGAASATHKVNATAHLIADGSWLMGAEGARYELRMRQGLRLTNSTWSALNVPVVKGVGSFA